MYTQESIDRIREVDIVQLINNYVTLKKSGANYKGLSPFTDEQTPSFMVSPVKNIFKCFSSGHGGDGIGFIQQYEGVDFIKAIEIIAQKCGVFLEREHFSEEKQKVYETRKDLIALSVNVAKQYNKELLALSKDHWTIQMLKDRGYDKETIIEFQLGFAPADNLVSKAVVQSAKLDLAKDVGLVKVKNGNSYDFFRDRVIFPIMDRNGQAIAFGGRRSNKEEDQKYQKYLNSPDSAIYKKSDILYGLHLAAIHINKSKTAILVEGYTDVISMHAKNANNTICTCGTALTDKQAGNLCRLADHVIIFRDGDKAGIKAAIRDIDILLATGVRVSVIIPEEGQDPDTIAQGQMDMSKFVDEYASDAIEWKADFLLKKCGDNPTEKVNVLNDILQTLSCIDNKLIRDEYTKKLGPLFGQSARTLNQEIKRILSERYEKRKAEAEKNGTVDVKGLPKGADIDEYLEKNYCTIGNQFWMKTKEGWNPVTNFKMTPLFHIKGSGTDTPRTFDVINIKGKRALVEVPSSVMLNLTGMQSLLLDAGVFAFDVNVNTIQFKTIMQSLIEECIEAKPFTYFGWQSKGFWAFANGIYQNEKFHEVNKYGIVVVENLEKVESEYYDNTPNYYSPAFSEMNKFKDDDQDEYENDRAFVFKSAKVGLADWMKQVVKVYGEKGNFAIAFSFASIFRDFILSRYSFFPHLFLTGEKGSGKSKFGDTIHKLFTYKLAPFDLNSGTIVGFYRRLARLKNVPAFFEEYHDKIDDRMFQSIKAAYDGRGREKGKMTDDNRTQISKVNSSMVIASQYLPNRDDNSVSERSIIIPFTKRDDYTQDDLQNYYKLKEWEESGLSSLVLQIVKHRNLIEQNFHEAYQANINRFKKDLFGKEYKERILNNFNALYTPITILYKCFEFPFVLQDFYTQCLNGVIDNSDMLTETEGLSEFWKTIEKLYERGQIKEGEHFIIDTPLGFTIQPKKGEKEEFSNSNKDRILFLRLNSVHQDYVNEVSRRDGVDVIGEGSLRTYFKAKRYFIGFQAAKRFKEKSTSCYCFNYDLMLDNDIINLEPFTKDETANPFPYPSVFNTNDDDNNSELPFEDN